ncbi:MAG: glycosyltransferase family 9 protein [Nitrospirota bacterium]|nr:glycosyltransferase family 9 protein [Nitrospirota bacterium]
MIGTYRLRKKLERRILGLSGWPARALRNPLAFYPPWKKNILNVARSEGIGDVLMCTPVLREARLRNPGGYIRFFTDYPQLVKGLPYIDEVLPMQESPESVIRLSYEEAVPTKFHLARIMGDCIGIDVDNVTPDCMVQNDLRVLYRNRWGNTKTIVALISPSKFTPNKEWPIGYWEELFRRILGKVRVVLVGSGNNYKFNFDDEMLVDLRSQTSLEDLVAIVSTADLYVGPVSGPFHISAALGVPSVVIAGGYELPENTSYEGSVALTRSPVCSPCWLRTECPYSKKCLADILPDEVEKEISRLLFSGKI